MDVQQKTVMHTCACKLVARYLQMEKVVIDYIFAMHQVRSTKIKLLL